MSSVRSARQERWFEITLASLVRSDAASGSGQGASGGAAVALSLAAAAALGASQLPAARADAAPVRARRSTGCGAGVRPRTRPSEHPLSAPRTCAPRAGGAVRSLRAPRRQRPPAQEHRALPVRGLPLLLQGQGHAGLLQGEGTHRGKPLRARETHGRPAICGVAVPRGKCSGGAPTPGPVTWRQSRPPPGAAPAAVRPAGAATRPAVGPAINLRTENRTPSLPQSLKPPSCPTRRSRSTP